MKVGSMVRIVESIMWMDLYTEYGIGIIIDIEPGFYKKGENKFDRVWVYWVGRNKIDFEPKIFLEEVR